MVGVDGLGLAEASARLCLWAGGVVHRGGPAGEPAAGRVLWRGAGADDFPGANLPERLCGGVGAGSDGDRPGGGVRLLLPAAALGFLRILNAQEGLRWGLLTGLGLLVSVLSEGLHRFRRRAEESRRRYAVTLGSISDAVITTDPTGRITLFNAEAERLTGWTGRRPPGSRWRRCCNCSAKTPACWRRIPSAGRSAKGLRRERSALLVARDGRETLIELTHAPIKQADGAIIGVVVVFRDATAKSWPKMPGRPGRNS